MNTFYLKPTPRRGPTVLVRPLYRLVGWLGAAALALLGTALVLSGVLWFTLRPAPGEWTTTLRVAGMPITVGTASMVWFATTPWVAQQLGGHTLNSRGGPVALHWEASSQSLQMRCQPCAIRNPSWGDAVLRVDNIMVAIQRNGTQLHGSVRAGAVAAQWHGRLTPQGLVVDVDLPPTPVRDGYALFAADIPEVAQARIGGIFSLRATLRLPSGELTLLPQIKGMTVQGLGTEQWGSARSSCGMGLAPLELDRKSPLVRAVLAAEDQRFYEHPGFDLTQWAPALHSNQDGAAHLRGASTLSQQVAKLLVTGGERSPVRKLRELLYAVDMEQSLGKARILHLYLNNAPWGATICGAQAAAHTYFGKRANQLSPFEAAWLAAMLHNPTQEAKRWACTGEINLVRTQWVARAMRAKIGSNRLAAPRRPAKLVCAAAPPV